MKHFAITAILAIWFASPTMAQVIRGGGNPYSSQLPTDPDAGTVQGIQRYGRPLAVDPAQGNTFPYYVFPTLQSRGAAPFQGQPTVPLTSQQRLRVSAIAEELKLQRAQLGPSAAGASASAQAGALVAGLAGATDSSSTPTMGNLASDYAALASPIHVPSRLSDPTSIVAEIRHQPLIQIKLRVIEVARSSGVTTASALDYIQRRSGLPSEFQGRGVRNINNSQRNLTSVSRFDVTGLLGIPADGTNLGSLTGTGALVNLTSRHVNWIASFLADELNADVVTAPELVTTNGEAVEFVAGSKEPFNLGTVNTSDDNDDSRISLFYKHVGSYIRVTPRIINFNTDNVGLGEADFQESDVSDWNQVIRFLLNHNLLVVENGDEAERKKRIEELTPYTRIGRLVPLSARTQVLESLNHYSRSDIQDFVRQCSDGSSLGDAGFSLAFFQSQSQCDCEHSAGDCQANRCKWNPSNCTIDLEILARFSNKSSGNLPGDLDGITSESEVRAIANTLQVRSGTGLVMAGLLGESDIETESKVPVLGDLPAVGFLFRAKSVRRQKTEILLMVEATVLPRDPCLAKNETIKDLRLSMPYVAAGTLEHPLELSLHQAGFGNYLPPLSRAEQDYWAKLSRRVNQLKTSVGDAIR